MLAAECVVALVARLVRPSLHTLAVLEIVLPHAFILSSVDVLVDTRTICLVVCPVTIIDITIYMGELSLTVSAILTPFSLIPGSIRPHLDAPAVSETAFPLSCIDRTCLELISWPVLTGLVGVVETLSHGLAGFFLSEVLAAAKLLSLEKRNQSAPSMTSPPGLELNNVLYVALQVAVILFTLKLNLRLTALRFIIAELLRQVFLPL